ncbi:MAG: SURF1 family protein [Rhodoluna sp.]|nr:SURF1 family protein [Rhodoluna sp.]
MSYLRDTWRNWVKWFAVVVVFAIACGFLSNWQFHRREEKLVKINLVIKNFDTPTVPVEVLLPQLSTWSGDLEWRAVSLEGHYLPTRSLLIRNRPNQGSPGFEQLVPFLTNRGRILLVSRGWLATGNEQDSPDVNPLPSIENREIVVRLRPSEQHDGRTAPERQVPNIEVPRIAKLLGLTNVYVKTYGRVYSDSSGEPKLRDLEAPATEEGNNFSYALQWIVFALMAFGALFWMIRQERDRSLGRVRVKVRKKPTDEDVEDSL